MLKEFTCIACPRGCDIEADIYETGARPDLSSSCAPGAPNASAEPCAPIGASGAVSSIRSLEGALCPKGRKFVEQELSDPRRNIATSVLVSGGAAALASVRLTGSIPKAMIFPVLHEVHNLTLAAPVRIGQVAIADILGLGVDLIVTSHVPVSPPPEPRVPPEPRRAQPPAKET